MKNLFNFFVVLLLCHISRGAVSASSAEKGKNIFETRGCAGCHSLTGSTNGMAPDLAGVSAFRSRSWLHDFIKDPEQMRNDLDVLKLKQEFSMSMPNLGLTDKETDQVIDYLSEFPFAPLKGIGGKRERTPTRHQHGMMMGKHHHQANMM